MKRVQYLTVSFVLWATVLMSRLQQSICNHEQDSQEEEFTLTDDCESLNGQFGQCVPLRSCPLFVSFLMRPLRKANLRVVVDYTCKFDLKEPKVCCPSTSASKINNRLGFVKSDLFDVRSEIRPKYPKIPNLSFSEDRFDTNYNYPPPPIIDNWFNDRSRLERRMGSSVPKESGLDALPITFVTNLLSHRNFKLLPKLQECSNAIKLDRTLGTFGTYPWLALVGNIGGDPRSFSFSHTCTATVISKRYLLTSAYCTSKSLRPSHIRLGEYNLDTELDYGPELLPPMQSVDYDIDTIVVHKNYSKTTRENDIALIRVSRDIDFNSPYMKPVCLPYAEEYGIQDKLEGNDITKFVGKLGWAVGWGNSPSGIAADDRILQEMSVPIISQDDCNQIFRHQKIFNPNKQFCTGEPRQEKRCVSDRGGPLLVPAKVRGIYDGVVGPKFFQFGINLQNPRRCNSEEFSLPTMYTKVSSYLEWILNNIEP